MPPKKKGPPKKPPNTQRVFPMLNISAIPNYTLDDWTRIAEGSNRAADFVRNHPPPPLDAPLIARDNYHSMVLDVFLGREQFSGSGIGSSRVAPVDVEDDNKRDNRNLYKVVHADKQKKQNRLWYKDLFEDVHPIETFEDDMRSFIESWKHRISNIRNMDVRKALRIINGTYYDQDYFKKELEEYHAKLINDMNELSPPYRAQNDARMRAAIAEYSLPQMKHNFRTWILHNFHGLAERP
jgi:hypothetical protein